MNIEVIRPASRLNSTVAVRITCVYYHKAKLYVGFSSGDFSIYDVDTTMVPPETKRPPSLRLFTSFNDIRNYFADSKHQESSFSHSQTFPDVNGDHSSIHRIIILSIDASINRIIFAIATNDIIRIFDKVGSHFNLIQTIDDSKGFTDVFHYEINGKIHLIIAIKKRLLVLQMAYKSRNLFSFNKVHELVLKDRIRAITSINLQWGLQLLIGLSTDFILVDISDNYATKSLFETVKAGTELITAFNQASFTYFGLGSAGPSIGMFKVQDGEYCLIKDNQILMVHIEADSVVVRESKVRLTSTPIHVSLIHPSYLIALYPKKVEIVELDTGDLVQKINHQINSSHIPVFINDQFIFLGAYNDLLQFNILAYQQQIDQYLRFTESPQRLLGLTRAINFVTKIDEEDEFFGGTRFGKEKRKLLYLRDLYKQKAFVLFDGSQYREALVNICSEWLISYKDVLDLFPSFLTCGYYQDHLTIAKQGIKKLTPDDLDSNTATVENFNKAVNNLIIYLTDQRRIHLNFFNDEKFLWKGIKLTPMDIYEITPELLDHTLEQISREIDTTLFLCYFYCKPMLLGPLLRLPNNKCDSSIVNECLLSKGNLSELLDFYFGRSLHHEALEMLTGLGDDTYVPDLVKYLQRLDNRYLELVFQYSEPILHDHTEYGQQIFMNNTYECESYDNFKVFEFLLSISRPLGIRYLEWLIFESDLAEIKSPAMPKFHTRLCILYLETLKEHLGDVKLTQNPIYKKLFKLLKTTNLYEPWTVLKHIPTNEPQLLRFTIFVYKRLGEHDKAIDVLFNQLDDLDGAVEYCSDMYKENPELSANLLHKLLEDLLMHYDENVDAIEKLLSTQGEKMSVLRVLTTLPNSFPIYRIKSFLKKQVQSTQIEAINKSLQSQLNKVGHVKLNHDLTMAQNKSYSIESSRNICEICHKKLGYSILCVDGERVVHYSCFNRDKE